MTQHRQKFLRRFFQKAAAFLNPVKAGLYALFVRKGRSEKIPRHRQALQGF
jgi:hypothetical protein